MSDNILQLLVDSIFDTGALVFKLIINLISKEEDIYDFDDFFETCRLCNSREIYPKLLKYYKTDLGTKYIFTLPDGLTLDNFKKLQNALEQQLDANIIISYASKCISIEVLEKKLQDIYEYEKPSLIAKDKIIIPVGMAITGVVKLDFSKQAHMYVVGQTGSGKSVFIKNFLTSLVNLYSKDEVKLWLADLKITELVLFKNVEHVEELTTTVEGCTSMIQELLKECNRRNTIFSNYEITNIEDYNKTFPNNKMHRIFFIIEECINLLQSPKKKAMRLLERLISISRSCGVHIILTMQRPDAQSVLSPIVKANISTKICFQVSSSKDSIVAIDTEGAEQIKNVGRALIRRDGEFFEMQSYYIKDNEVKTYLKQYKMTHLNPPGAFLETSEYKVKADTKDAKQKQNKNIKIKRNINDEDYSYLDEL